MEPPIGFIRLRDAADIVGEKLYGSKWQPLAEMAMVAMCEMDISLIAPDVILCGLNPHVERVITMIAEQCEVGKIAATYRSITGADDLDQSVWRARYWRLYFARGKIDLDLPLLDPVTGRGREDGHTARCCREIFVRRQDLLDHLVSRPAHNENDKPLRSASEKEIRREVHAVYAEAGERPPNIKQLPKHVRPRLNRRGLDASENRIAEIGGSQEFEGLRRPPGKTIASERR
jgi:hypothetical protein